MPYRAEPEPEAPTIDPVALDDRHEDLIYFARVGDLLELDVQLGNACGFCQTHPFHVLMATRHVESGNTLLHLASANGHEDVVEYLLKFDPHNRCEVGLWPMGCGVPAALHPSLLLHILNNSGNTALHYAAMNGQLPIVKRLVTAGADVHILNEAGHSPAHEAELAGRPETAEWLLEYIATRHTPEWDSDMMEPEGSRVTNGVALSDGSSPEWDEMFPAHNR